MKRCSKCGDEKPEDEFYKAWYRRKDGTRAPSARCKLCQKRLSSKQRKGPKREAYLKYQREYGKIHKRDERLERLRRMDAIKAGRPCEDCGHYFPPECMDFDHIDPKTKLFTISNAVVSHSHSWEDILFEIGKCRLICANCHRIRTAKQNHRGK